MDQIEKTHQLSIKKMRPNKKVALCAALQRVNGGFLGKEIVKGLKSIAEYFFYLFIDE